MVTNDLSGMEKEELEKLKLIAEIKDLERSSESARRNSNRENIKSWLTIIISVATIVTAVFTIGTTIDSYVKQKAQSEKLIVDEKLLKVVEKLNSDKKEDREYATVLLSAYEKNAIPILLKYLEWNDEPERLIHLLKNIKQKISTSNFNDMLMNSANEVFQLEIINLRSEGNAATENTDKAKTAIINYLLTLEELGGDKEKISSMLVELKKHVGNSSLSIEKITRDSILTMIRRVEGGLKNK